MAFLGLFGRKRHERAGFQLYTEAVRAARDPYYYSELGVPDTLDGRFDMIGLFVVLLIDRLRAAPKPGAALAQAVFDAMFMDMDQALRELGVSDMAVGKRVKAMWEALHGRAEAYAPALAAQDQAALAAALARNVWRGAAPDGSAQALASIAAGEYRRLADEPAERLLAGHSGFIQVSEAAA